MSAREAAERVRRHRNGEDIYDIPHAGYCKEKQADEIAIVNAYLAENHTDDETPTTCEWLQSVGIHFGSRKMPDLDADLTIDSKTKWAYIEIESDSHCGGHTITIPFPATRRDVQILCRALGIKLKEHGVADSA